MRICIPNRLPGDTDAVFKGPLFKNHWLDFPGGPVVKSLPSSAGDLGMIPHQGTQLPHGMEQLSLCTATREML